MNIQITSDRLISEIQNEFNQAFPFLKMEFFRKGNHFRNSIQNTPYLLNQLTIGHSYMNNEEGKVRITALTIAKDLKKECEKQFGISVRLYRKSGNLWLEITMTSHWTMKQQNDQGREICTLIDKKNEINGGLQ